MESFQMNTFQDLEFFASEELIDIVPNFKGEQFKFVSGTYGPFRPSKPVTIPLWLALHLKERKKCNIKAPIWLDYELLTKIKEEEKQIEYFSE